MTSPGTGRERWRAYGYGVAAVLTGLSTAGCVSRTNVVGTTPAGDRIVEISLSLSNAYLVARKPAVLIDTGSDTDLVDLDSALSEYGVARSDIGLVVVTHAHADHASLAAILQQTTNASIMLGAGDVDQAARGHNDELHPQNATASFLKLGLSMEFTPFEPDIVVSDPVDLKPWGLDGTAMEMPGHTAGSIVVLLSNHSAFVGDDILGGELGGAFHPHDPGEHYFQADPKKNRENVEKLVRLGVETFYLGHGGPVSRKDVVRAFHIADQAPSG